MACFRKKVSGCVATSLLLTSLSSYAETTDRWLPFWGNEARAMGYDLPEPFGVSASYMQIRQDIKVKEINFENLALIPGNLDETQVGKINEMLQTILLDQSIFDHINSIIGNGVLVEMMGSMYESDPDGFTQALKDLKIPFSYLIIKHLKAGDLDKIQKLLEVGLESGMLESGLKEMLEGIDLDKLQDLTGFESLNLPSSLFKIDVGETKQRSHTENIRLDTWLFPFLNIYGILGQTKGHSISTLSIKTNFNEFLDNELIQSLIDSGIITEELLDGILNNINNSLGTNLQDIDFRLDFKGKTYGGGATLAGGTGDFFALVDANYTWTRFDVLDGSIRAFTIAPRIGYRFTTPAIERLNLKPGKLNVWVGSMYQDIQQDFRGSLDNLRIPPELQELIGMVDSAGLGRFEVKQELEKPWNLLIGLRYEPTPHFALTTELGFEDRESIFISGEFRF